MSFSLKFDTDNKVLFAQHRLHVCLHLCKLQQDPMWLIEQLCGLQTYKWFRLHPILVSRMMYCVQYFINHRILCPIDELPPYNISRYLETYEYPERTASPDEIYLEDAYKLYNWLKIGNSYDLSLESCVRNTN